MDEEEDKDGKMDEMERKQRSQDQTGEESKQERSTSVPSKVQIESKNFKDNEGVQDKSSEEKGSIKSFHVQNSQNSETQMLKNQVQEDNEVYDKKQNITLETGSAACAIEPSADDDQHYLFYSSRSSQARATTGETSVKTTETNKMMNKDYRNDEASKALQVQPTESLKANTSPMQLQLFQDSEQNESLIQILPSQKVVSSTTDSTEHYEQPQEEKKIINKQGIKSGKEHCGSPKKQMKQTTSGEVGKKQVHAYESKPETSQTIKQRQKQFNKGQKVVQVPRKIGKENQQMVEKENIYKLRTKTQELQNNPEAYKMQGQKKTNEQAKFQPNQKMQKEEKQKFQVKDVKKQSLLQKEQKDTKKQEEMKKFDKGEQKSPIMQKKPQNFTSMKSCVYRKEQVQPSPKKQHASELHPKEKQSQVQKKIKQKGGNPILITKNESKVTASEQPIEDCSLSIQYKQDSFAPQRTEDNLGMDQQNMPEEDSPKENAQASSQLERESRNELVKEHGYEERVIQKPYSTNSYKNQGQKVISKEMEKKSNQQKQNDIRKQKQHNEVKEQLRKQKDQNSAGQKDKIRKKLQQGAEAPMTQNKEETRLPLLLEGKQISEIKKEETMGQKSSVEQSGGKDIMKREVRIIDGNSSNKQRREISANTEDQKHNQQLEKEELLQQQLLNKNSSQSFTHKEEKQRQQQKPQNKTESKEDLDQQAQKNSEEYDDKDAGCGGIQGSNCPIYFGVKSYLHHFYDTSSVKNPQLYEENVEEDDFEFTVDPIKQRGCRKCCQGFWFRAGLWGGINLILVGVITFLVGYLTPQREMVVGQQGDLEILDRSAIIFNHRLELCRLAGLAVFCCGGMVLFVVLFISTLLHVKGHNNSENTCCAETMYYDYTTTALVEPFIVAQAQDLTMPTGTSIKIPIVEQIKSIQPTLWPEMGTIKEGSRVGQMP